MHCLLLTRLICECSSHILTASHQVRFIIFGVCNKCGAPRMPLQRLPRNQDSCGSHCGRQVLEGGVLLKASLSKIACHLDHGSVGVGSFEVSAQESVNCGNSQVILQSIHHLGLHLNNFLLSISSICNKHQVSQLRGVNLFIFCSQLFKNMIIEGTKLMQSIPAVKKPPQAAT